MNKNLGWFPKIKHSWMNISKYFFILLFFVTSSSFAATYEEGKKAYLAQDYELALEILKPLAENGNAQAQITLGLMYDYGHGVEKSASESIKWYLMAAEQGVPLVQHDMGVKYFQGQGVEQNYDEAARWWEMSANAGIADSQFNLGLMYYRGIGIEKDYVKAAKLFEAAAEQGHGNAQYSLAVMYAFGQSKEKSYATALKWFNKAAEQNVAQAQFNLGVFNENGYGLAKDLNKAREWYQLAANQGLQEAKEKLKTLPKQETVSVAEEKSTKTISEETVIENNTTEPVATTPPASVNELNLSQWLRQQAADNYTIQLGSVVNEKDIVKYIQSSGLGSNAGYIEVIVNGITRYTAIYGLYDTYQKAEMAVSELPKAVQNTKPWVRNTGILQGLLR
ncbi:MAG: SPOR domain-containing protein [Gammaproteobacteria bacterium]|jgi:TPR repeat protein